MDSIKLEERFNRLERLLIANKKVLTFDEACDYSGISRAYMYNLTSKNKIPFSKPNGKVIFFSKDELDTWLLRNKQTSKEEIKDKALNYVLRNKKA